MPRNYVTDNAAVPLGISVLSTDAEMKPEDPEPMPPLEDGYVELNNNTPSRCSTPLPTTPPPDVCVSTPCLSGLVVNALDMRRSSAFDNMFRDNFWTPSDNDVDHMSRNLSGFDVCNSAVVCVTIRRL